MFPYDPSAGFVLSCSHFFRSPTSAPPLPLPLSFPSPPSTSVDIPVYLVVETPLISMTWPVPSSDDDDDVIVHRDPSQPTNQPTNKNIQKKKTKKKTNISSDVFLEREDGLIFHLIRVLMTLYSVVFDLFCRTRNKRNRIFDTDTRLIPGSC